ncbi:MAG: hypothetical protein ACOH1H_02990, partial [Brevundimonas sp.]
FEGRTLAIPGGVSGGHVNSLAVAQVSVSQQAKLTMEIVASARARQEPISHLGSLSPITERQHLEEGRKTKCRHGAPPIDNRKLA